MASDEGQAVEKPAEAEYVVQLLRRDFVFEGNEHSSPTSEIEAWVDLPPVKLPLRRHRKHAIKVALAEAGITPDPKSPPVVRVLDADSARVVEVEVVVRGPEFDL